MRCAETVKLSLRSVDEDNVGLTRTVLLLEMTLVTDEEADGLDMLRDKE